MLNFLRKIGSFFLDLIETVVIALSVFIIIYLFLFQPHQVKGNSMYPNFYDGEYILTDKISYRLGKPERGDVIIFRAPKNEEYDYIKRILALPGETVTIESCHISINSDLMEEDYLSTDSCTTGGGFARTSQTVTLPADHYFVLGDNRTHSSDSREWGFVPKQNIVGKAWMRYWPPNRIGLIEEAQY